MSLKMIKRYLKIYYCNPSEIGKYTFYQIIKKANENTIIQKGVNEWKLFRDCRIKVNESYEEKIADEIISTIPNFLKEAQYFIVKLKDHTHG